MRAGGGVIARLVSDQRLIKYSIAHVLRFGTDVREL